MDVYIALSTNMIKGAFLVEERYTIQDNTLHYYFKVMSIGITIGPSMLPYIT